MWAKCQLEKPLHAGQARQGGKTLFCMICLVCLVRKKGLMNQASTILLIGPTASLPPQLQQSLGRRLSRGIEMNIYKRLNYSKIM